jgi:hypothetical protein
LDTDLPSGKPSKQWSLARLAPNTVKYGENGGTGTSAPHRLTGIHVRCAEENGPCYFSVILAVTSGNP